MAALIDILKGFDRATAGWKTYTGIGVAAVALGLGHFGVLPENVAQAFEAAGVLLAGAGKLAADVRPPEPRP